MAKILFVYPNREGYPIIPIAFSLLSAILKREGHQIDFFDITFMVENRDYKARAAIKSVQDINDVDKFWGNRAGFNIPQELTQRIKTFDPDLVAFTIVENNYGCARDLFKIVKAAKNVPILVGGMFPTVASQFFVKDRNVDLICLGEGECTMVELAKRIDAGGHFLEVPNCIAKLENGKTSRGPTAPYYRWDPHDIQDWSIFDQRHLHKPFMGKMHKTGYFEMSRGCLFKCTYCNNLGLQQLSKAWGIEEKYNRDKPLPLVMEEISRLQKEYGLELIFFNDENFLQIPHARLVEFCHLYQEQIGLPFFIQTTAQTLKREDHVQLLKESGCVTVGVGVEHGNYQLRSKMLNKNTPDEEIERAIGNCNKYDLRTTAFVMVGIPGETEETLMETVAFCKKIKAPSITLSIFAPYHGTPLREYCVQHGYIEDKYYEEIGLNFRSVLNMPQLSSDRLEWFYYNFTDLVFGENKDRNPELETCII